MTPVCLAILAVAASMAPVDRTARLLGWLVFTALAVLALVLGIDVAR